MQSKDWGDDQIPLTLSLGYVISHGASPVAQMVKNLPPMQEACMRSLGQEDPLEKEITTHSSILAWRISWTDEPGRLESMGTRGCTQLSN